MANPVLTEFDYYAPTWVDNENNWRADDVHFLRNRSVLKFPTEALATAWFGSRTPAVNPTGSISFIAADLDIDDDIEVGSDPYFVGYYGGTDTRRLLSAKYLRIPTLVDTSTSVTLRHSVDTGGGVSIASDGSVKAESTFKVGSRVEVTTLGEVKLKDATTGTGTLQLTEGVLTSNTRFNCTGITTTGTVSTGALTATALTVSSGGALVTGNSTVTGNLVVTGTITQATSVTSPIISTGSSDGNARLTTAGLSAVSGTASVQLVANGTGVKVISPGPSDPFMFQNATTETLTRVAGVNVSTSPVPAPGGATYPEGTIWLQVS